MRAVDCSAAISVETFGRPCCWWPGRQKNGSKQVKPWVPSVVRRHWQIYSGLESRRLLGIRKHVGDLDRRISASRLGGISWVELACLRQGYLSRALRRAFGHGWRRVYRGTAILPGLGTAIGAAAGAVAGLIRGIFSGPSWAERVKHAMETRQKFFRRLRLQVLLQTEHIEYVADRILAERQLFFDFQASGKYASSGESDIRAFRTQAQEQRLAERKASSFLGPASEGGLTRSPQPVHRTRAVETLKLVQPKSMSRPISRVLSIPGSE